MLHYVVVGAAGWDIAMLVLDTMGSIYVHRRHRVTGFVCKMSWFYAGYPLLVHSCNEDLCHEAKSSHLHLLPYLLQLALQILRYRYHRPSIVDRQTAKGSISTPELLDGEVHIPQQQS